MAAVGALCPGSGLCEVCCGMGGGLLGVLCSSQQGRRSSQLCWGHPECREGVIHEFWSEGDRGIAPTSPAMDSIKAIAAEIPDRLAPSLP